MVTNTITRPGHIPPKPLDTQVTVAPDLSVRGPTPVVRDHRTATTQNAAPVIRDHRKPVDNTIYGTGPGLGDVLDAGMNGLGKVGNVFGIGYGSVTSGAPTRPQTVDHRNR